MGNCKRPEHTLPGIWASAGEDCLDVQSNATSEEILGVKPSDSATDIKRAYYKLANKWHPDKNPGHQELATKIFKKLGEAYAALSPSAPEIS